MSKARARALPYAISKLLRQRSPDPIDAPGLVKIAQAHGTRLTLDEVVALNELLATWPWPQPAASIARRVSTSPKDLTGPGPHAGAISA